LPCGWLRYAGRLNSGVRGSVYGKCGSGSLRHESESLQSVQPNAHDHGMLRRHSVVTDRIFNPHQDTRMSKGLNQKKNSKKAPAKTADEKRAAKREKAKQS